MQLDYSNWYYKIYGSGSLVADAYPSDSLGIFSLPNQWEELG